MRADGVQADDRRDGEADRALRGRLEDRRDRKPFGAHRRKGARGDAGHAGIFRRNVRAGTGAAFHRIDLYAHQDEVIAKRVGATNGAGAGRPISPCRGGAP